MYFVTLADLILQTHPLTKTFLCLQLRSSKIYLRPKYFQLQVETALNITILN